MTLYANFNSGLNFALFVFSCFAFIYFFCDDAFFFMEDFSSHGNFQLSFIVIFVLIGIVAVKSTLICNSYQKADFFSAFSLAGTSLFGLSIASRKRKIIYLGFLNALLVPLTIVMMHNVLPFSYIVFPTLALGLVSLGFATPVSFNDLTQRATWPIALFPIAYFFLVLPFFSGQGGGPWVWFDLALISILSWATSCRMRETYAAPIPERPAP